MADDIKFTIGGTEKGFLKSLSNVEKATVTTGKNITSTFKTAGVAISAAISAYGANQIVDIADQYTLLDGRLKLVVDSTEELAETQADLYDISQRTRQEYAQTATLYTNLARATKDLNLSQSSLVGITETLNQALVVSGASQEEAGNSMRQFNQAMMGGIVRAEEYNSMLENTPRVLEAVADGLGITMGQLREEMLASQLTSERFLEGLKNGSADVRREFEEMPTTVDQAMTTLENAFKDIVSEANKASGATSGIATAITELTTTIEENKGNIMSLFEGMIESGGWVIQIMSDIATEIKVMSAVAAGVLDVTDYLSMGMAEMRAWVDDFDAGIADTLKNIAELQDKIAELENSPRKDWAVNQGQIDEYKAELNDLYAELDRKQQQYADKSVAIEKAANSEKIASAKSTTTAINSEQDKRLSAAKKALDAEVKAAVKAGNKMVDFWQVQAKDKWDVISRTYDYEIAAEEEKNAKILDELDAYFEEEKDLYSDKNSDIIKLQDELVNDMGQIMSGFVEDVLRGEIDDIGDMFESLFDSILDMFIRLVGQIAANSLIEAMGFGGTGDLSIQGLMSSSGLGTAASIGSTGYQAATGQGLAGAAASALGLGGTGTVAATDSSMGVAYGTGKYATMATYEASKAGATSAVYEWGGYPAVEAAPEAGLGLTASSAIGIGAPVAALAGIIAGWASLGSPSYAGIDTGVGSNRLNVRDYDEDGVVSQAEVFKDMDNNIEAMDKYSAALETLEKGTNESGKAAIGAGSAQADLQEALTKSQYEIETMALVFGNQTAKMALDLDGTIPSFDDFADAIAGYDVSLNDATRYHWLAKEAVEGTAGAADTLYDEMLKLTGSAEDAQIATMGMIASINDLSNTPLSIDVKVNEQVVSSVDSGSYMSGQFSSDNQSYVSSSSSSKSSDRYASWNLNNHAVGGIYTRPTLLSDRYGGMHQVAETGSAEAIIPLSAPDQMDQIQNQVNLISEENKSIMQTVAVNTKKIAKIVARWEAVGLPGERAVA